MLVVLRHCQPLKATCLQLDTHIDIAGKRKLVEQQVHVLYGKFFSQTRILIETVPVGGGDPTGRRDGDEIVREVAEGVDE